MQAIVLLHDEEAFRPLGVAAWALPVGDQPAVELTLRWLERSAISEVHLVTSSSSALQLGAYLRQAGWAGASRRGTAVHVLATPGCLSEGEALRFVEQKDVVKGDFVLVSGCVVGNADLRPAVQAHAARRIANRQALMTLLLHHGCSTSGASATSPDNCLVVVDSCSQQLLKLEHNTRAGHATSLGTHVFGERNAIAVHAASGSTSSVHPCLRLSNVYICAPDALVLLSDNFDYQGIAGDLVPGVLSEQELGSTLYIHALTRGYVERVSSRSGYASIVADMVGRWTYPWVPDNSGNQLDSCRFNRGTYVDASASVAPSSHASKGSLIGRGSRVDAGAHLDHCIVGSDCHIGKGTTLQGTCLHAHVRVDESCRLAFALLAENVVVRSHAQVETGAVLAKHTVVDTAQCVPAGVCVSLIQPRPMTGADSEDETEWPCADTDQLGAIAAAAAALAGGGIPETDVGFHEDIVGPFGVGFVWLEQGNEAHHVARFPAGLSERESGCDSDAGDFTKDASAVDNMNADEQEQQAADQFKREVAETFLRCIKERISHDNAVIELNGLKIAEDRTFADCARYIFTTMLSLCLPPSTSIRPEYVELFPGTQVDLRGKEGRLELLFRLNVQLKAWKELLHRFLKSHDDQVELLLTFEEYCAEEGDFSARDHGSLFADLFPQVVKLCYDHDLLCEDAILDWASEKENAASEERHYVELCADLLAWLEDAEEESD